MTIPFDPTDYVRAPVITVSSGTALALALLDATPKTAEPHVKKAAKHLESVAKTARTQLAERNRIAGTFSEEDTRAIDNEADRAWGGLRMRIQAMAMLAPETTPKAERAAALDAQLFGAGTAFLKADYATQSTTMASVLKRIDDDGLASDIEAIAGRDFLKAVRDIQPEYEAMVSQRLRRDGATGQNLADTVRALQGAIVNYASKVIATVEHDDPATVEAARVALLPITNFRDATSASPRGGTKSAPAPIADGADPA